MGQHEPKIDFQKLNGKEFWFCGERWTLKCVRKMPPDFVATYDIPTRIMKIKINGAMFDSLMHELLECATQQFKVRFENSQNGLLFSFDHDTLDNIAREISGALAQILQVE